MVRTLGGIVAGMATAIVIIMISEAIGNQIASPTSSYEVTTVTEGASQSLAPVLPALVGCFLGALAGGFVAIKISQASWTAWAVTGVVLAATIVNFLMLRYPVAVMIAGVVLPLAGGWIARRFSRTRDGSEISA